MKKLIVLVALFTTAYVTNANAQEKPAGDASAMVEKYKEKLKPQLMEKVSLSSEEADQVLRIHFMYANRMRNFENASAEEKQKKTEMIQAAENKELAAIPLSAEKVKAVNDFFAAEKAERAKRKAAAAGTTSNN